MGDWLTFQMIADELHVSVGSVHRWAAEGRFPTYKPGKERLVKREDLDAFVESTREEPGRRDRLDAAVEAFADKFAEALAGGLFQPGRAIEDVLQEVGVAGVPPEVAKRVAKYVDQYDASAATEAAEELKKDPVVRRILGRLELRK